MPPPKCSRTAVGFCRRLQQKIGGRPRSDFVIAPGLWAAIDAHICQNRQNSAVDNATGGFGGFVTPSSDVAPDESADVGTGLMPSVVIAYHRRQHG